MDNKDAQERGLKLTGEHTYVEMYPHKSLEESFLSTMKSKTAIAEACLSGKGFTTNQIREMLGLAPIRHLNSDTKEAGG